MSEIKKVTVSNPVPEVAEVKHKLGIFGKVIGAFGAAKNAFDETMQAKDILMNYSSDDKAVIVHTKKEAEAMKAAKKDYIYLPLATEPDVPQAFAYIAAGFKLLAAVGMKLHASIFGA